MATPPSVLNKVKLLLKLADSPNPHEADSARKLAEGLIAKHNITDQELESLKDPKPLYGEDEKLFQTVGLVSWRQQLALAVGNHFGCQIVQEELVPLEGPHPFHYYAYGEPEDVKNVQFAFQAFAHNIENLVATNCLLRGPVYIASYCEGVVEAIKHNIITHGIDIPEQKRAVREAPKEVSNIAPGTIEKPKEKPPTADNRIDVNSQNLIKDIMAYFAGLEDGKILSISIILTIASKSKESENETQDTKEFPASKSKGFDVGGG